MGNLYGWLVVFFSAVTDLGDTEGILVGKFEGASRWDNQKEFWWETGKMKWLVKIMELWLGGSKEDVTWENEWI